MRKRDRDGVNPGQLRDDKPSARAEQSNGATPADRMSTECPWQVASEQHVDSFSTSRGLPDLLFHFPACLLPCSSLPPCQPTRHHCKSAPAFFFIRELSAARSCALVPARPLLPLMMIPPTRPRRSRQSLCCCCHPSSLLPSLRRSIHLPH